MAGPKRNESKIIIAIDVDGTLTPISSSWSFYHLILGTRTRSKLYGRLYFEGVISYDEWVYLDLMLWKNLHRNTLEMLSKAIPLRHGVERLKSIKRRFENVVFIAISGGFADVACSIANKLGLDYCIGTVLDFNDDRFLGTASTYIDYNGKDRALVDLIEKEGIKPSLIIAIGDSENDISLFNYSDISIAFCTSPRVGRYATIYLRTCRFDVLVDTLIDVLTKLIYALR